MAAYFYCPDCGNTFKGEAVFNPHNEREVTCPIVSCCGLAFEIDEDMLIPIDILNRKGYSTQYCCSGHTFGVGGGYVKFYDFSMPETIPKGWVKDGNEVIRFEVGEMLTPIERRKLIHRKIDELIKWCDELPYAED